MAENKLTCDVMNKRLAAIHTDLLDPILFYYPPPRGLQRLQEAMAAYANRTFMQAGVCHGDASSIMHGSARTQANLVCTLYVLVTHAGCAHQSLRHHSAGRLRQHSGPPVLHLGR